ncbi:MAG: hypothetical protein ILNGONEN_00229 [Syntrophorhabdaceae bacterium]|nr:hypothetical protein [Syntrophorhabdaceae bacterium]
MMSSMMGTASFNGVLPLIDIILIARFIMDALQLNLSFMAFIVLFISDSMGSFLFSISFCKERGSRKFGVSFSRWLAGFGYR